MKSKQTIIIICSSIVAIILVSVLGGSKSLIDILSLLIAGISVICILMELNTSRQIAESKFIATLNNSFVENDDYKRMYRLLDSYDFENTENNIDVENCDISNYLTFFEVFWILKTKNIIDFEMFDDLFAYRFFIAVHNPIFQKKKLVRVPGNFKNIYKLERDWIAFRKNRGKSIFREEYSLCKMVDPKVYSEVTK